MKGKSDEQANDDNRATSRCACDRGLDEEVKVTLRIVVGHIRRMTLQTEGRWAGPAFRNAPRVNDRVEIQRLEAGEGASARVQQLRMRRIRATNDETDVAPPTLSIRYPGGACSWDAHVVAVGVDDDLGRTAERIHPTRVAKDVDLECVVA